MQIPQTLALRLGVFPHTTATTTLADGSRLLVGISRISVVLGKGGKKPGTAQISYDGSLILLGMEFLQIFNVKLTVSHREGVILSRIDQ